MLFLVLSRPASHFWLFSRKFTTSSFNYSWNFKKTTSAFHLDRDNKKLQLNDGNFIPRFGLGVWQLKEGKETVNAVRWALQYGYRQIDTASRYGNETSVGKAIRESGVPREEIFVSSKVYDDDHGYEATLKSFHHSLSSLGLDYVDLYLIHSPVNARIVSTWKAMVELQQNHLVRSVGVSNFGIHHLVKLQEASSVTPSVNQIEVHPFLQEQQLVRYCRQHDITVQAYSPLANGRRFDDKILLELSKKYQCSAAVILIQWCLQKGYVCIPKSGTRSRIQENLTGCELRLKPRDIKLLDSLNENYRTCHEKIKTPWVD